MDLIQLNNEKGLLLTDKHGDHDYLSVYEKLFSPYRDKEINIFEVGYWNGGSCELWKRYFPYAQIRAIDVKIPRTKRGKGYRFISTFIPPKGRVHLDLINVRNLTANYFNDFPPDIAIDDGSHMLEDQVYFVKLVYPLLNEGGVLIVEDIENLYTARRAFEELGFPFEMLDRRNRMNQYDNVLAIFKK